MDTHSSATPTTEPEQGPADWTREVASDGLFTEQAKRRLRRLRADDHDLVRRLRDEAAEWTVGEPVRELLLEAADWIVRRE